MSAGHLAPFISPLMPFNFIAMATDTRALSGFMMMDLSLLNEEWGAPLGRVFSVLIQGHVSQKVGGVAFSLYKTNKTAAGAC